MRETTAEIAELQELLDAAYGRSTEHLRSIVTDERNLTAEELIRALTGMCTLNLATVTAKGEPRISAVDGHFLHARWVFSTAHSAAKAAQAMLTRVLARALAPEVRVCGVAPGPVAVEEGQEDRRAAETLLGRVGSPADVADAVAYLAGAGYVTGSTLVVDGGRLIKSGRGPIP